jgi:TonB family protein
MTHLNNAFAKLTMLLPLVLMSAALAAPAYSNTFHGVYTDHNRNVGSAPNPTSLDINKNRHERHYPLESQMRKEEGTVELTISLTRQGTVNDVVVENSSGFPRLDNAALDYVKASWKYSLTDDERQPIPATVRIKVTFDMP